MSDVRPSPWRAIAAATALNAPLGSLYAFSVFLKSLETLLGLTRAELALVFALASAGFGVGMNVAPHVFGLASTPTLVLACAAASTLGIALAATAGGLAQLAIGYGVLFGTGGGAAHILVQQAVNLAVTRRHGLVNGYIVALYPAGAMIAAPPLRVGRPRIPRARHARRARHRPGGHRIDQRVADRPVRRHALGGGRGRGRATPARVLAAVARLLPGGIRRADGAQSGRRHQSRPMAARPRSPSTARRSSPAPSPPHAWGAGGWSTG